MAELLAPVFSLEPCGRADCSLLGNSDLESLASEKLRHTVLGLPESPEHSDSASLTFVSLFLGFPASLSLGYLGALPWCSFDRTPETKRRGNLFLEVLLSHQFGEGFLAILS